MRYFCDNEELNVNYDSDTNSDNKKKLEFINDED